MNLKQMDITGGSNGYPEPITGKFIFGFDSYEQAKEWLEDEKLDNENAEIGIMFYKNGWAVGEYKGCESSALPISRFIDGDNDYLFESKTEIKDFFQEYQDDSYYSQDEKKRYKSILKECLEDFREGKVLHYDGNDQRPRETYPEFVMDFYDESNNHFYKIGIYVPFK